MDQTRKGGSTTYVNETVLMPARHTANNLLLLNPETVNSKHLNPKNLNLDLQPYQHADLNYTFFYVGYIYSYPTYCPCNLKPYPGFIIPTWTPNLCRNLCRKIAILEVYLLLGGLGKSQ